MSVVNSGLHLSLTSSLIHSIYNAPRLFRKSPCHFDRSTVGFPVHSGAHLFPALAIPRCYRKERVEALFRFVPIARRSLDFIPTKTLSGLRSR